MEAMTSLLNKMYHILNNFYLDIFLNIPNVLYIAQEVCVLTASIEWIEAQVRVRLIKLDSDKRIISLLNIFIYIIFPMI